MTRGPRGSRERVAYRGQKISGAYTAKADVERVRKPRFRMAVQTYIAPLAKATVEQVARLAHNTRILREIPGGNSTRLPETDDFEHILGPGPLPMLLSAAVENRLERYTLADIQRTNSLGSVKLVPGNGKQIHPELVHIDRNLPERLGRIGVL